MEFGGISVTLRACMHLYQSRCTFDQGDAPSSPDHTSILVAQLAVVLLQAEVSIVVEIISRSICRPRMRKDGKFSRRHLDGQRTRRLILPKDSLAFWRVSSDYSAGRPEMVLWDVRGGIIALFPRRSRHGCVSVDNP